MPKIRPRRPRYADVAATLALILAMGGTAYAVNALPANSVGTAQLKNGAVTNPKLANSAVGQAKLADGSVTTAKFAPGSVTGHDIANNTVSLTQIVGTDVTGAISFSLGAHACGNLSMGIGGAQVGQVAVMSWIGNVAPPSAVTFSELKVTSAGHIDVRACNNSASSMSVSGIGVRVITFG